MRVLTVVVILLLAAAPAAMARPGDLDRSFANQGRVAYKVWGTGGANVALTLLDGRRPLMSVAAFRAGQRTPAFLQLTAAGRLARRTAISNPQNGAPLIAQGYWLQPLVPTYGTPLQVALTRIGSSRSGTLTLGADIYELSAFGKDASGRTYVAGSLLKRGGFVMRFLPTGAVDTTYGASGRVELNAYEPMLVIRRDGRVIVADALDIYALDPAGRLIPSFANGRLPRPSGIKGRAESFVAGPSGSFLVAGSGESRGWVARLRANGKLDKRFGDKGFLYRPQAFRYASVEAIARDRRGRIVLAGTSFESRTDDSYAGIVIRLTRSGRMDRSFGKGGAKIFRLGVAPDLAVSGSNIDSVAIDDRGRIVVAGEVFDSDFEFREDTGTPYPAIARLLG